MLKIGWGDSLTIPKDGILSKGEFHHSAVKISVFDWNFLYSLLLLKILGLDLASFIGIYLFDIWWNTVEGLETIVDRVDWRKSFFMKAMQFLNLVDVHELHIPLHYK